jgi:hypothetical protein
MTKITIDREAMRILIDELADGNFAIYPEIMKMLDGAAQPAEPVAWLCENAAGHKYFRWKKPMSEYKPKPLYTQPPTAPVRHEEFSCPLCFDQPAHVPLTDEQIDKIFDGAHENMPKRVLFRTFVARAIEAVHGITAGDKP